MSIFLYCNVWSETFVLHHYLHVDSVQYQVQPHANQDVVTVLHDTDII